jgi:L-asparaginase
MEANKLSHIYIINTGGTISMVQDQSTGSVDLQESGQMRQYLPNLQVDVEVRMEDLFHVPSSHMTLLHMYQLAKHVQEKLDQEEVIGVVITHGTDSLEETAYYLDLTLKSEKPVVVTGAMRSQNELGSDGSYNLNQSIRVAADPTARDRGVMVVFQDKIHAAKYVTKTHTSQLSAFQSMNIGPIGSINQKRVQFNHPPHRHNPVLPLVEPSAKVELLKAVTDMNPAIMDWVLEQNVDGLVIEALGQGNLPPQILAGCYKALDKKIPIVLVSRCIEGQVAGVYQYKGGGAELIKANFLFDEDISGPKARLKLIATLSADRLDQVYST